MTEEKNGNGTTNKILLEELRAVRARADKIQANLDREQTINSEQISRNQLITYRVDKLETAVTEIQHSVKNIEDFVTRSSAGGVSMKTIGLIAGVVSVILGGVFAAIFKAAGIQ